MKNENYITIQGWMVKELQLTGNDLICYALIYGFTQNGNYWDKSSSYISEWLGVSKRCVVDILKRLVDDKLIEKQDYEVNGVKFCKYRHNTNVANFIGSAKSAQGGSEEFSPHRNNILEYNNKEKEEYKYSSQKNEGIEEEIKTWRESFDEYLKLVYEAQAKLLNDVEFKKQKELYHANLDYELSLEKMVKEYWATDTGWGQKKKNKKVKNIDMVTTLKKAFDLSCNRVYKQINTRQKQNVVEPTKTPDNPFYTVVPLNSKLKFIDKRGTLNDGTFVEDGYRYYLSQKDGMKYSIPPKAEPMPHQDCEYDMKSNKWYEPKQNQNSDGLFLF